MSAGLWKTAEEGPAVGWRRGSEKAVLGFRVIETQEGPAHGQGRSPLTGRV